MPENPEKHQTDLTVRFRAELNKHGYPFQFATVYASELASQRSFSAHWLFEAAEFPVYAQGQGTRIDFILKRADQEVYMLVECKRVDPALSNWCFARFPCVGRNRTNEVFLAEQFLRNGPSSGAAQLSNVRGDYYNIGLEVKEPTRTGDGTGGGRGAIEDAASQACRGLNGMVECFAARAEMGFQAVLIPAIFTTAHLWGCDVGLASGTDIETGKIKEDQMANVRPLKVVLYQYHQSPGLKHGLSRAEGPKTLGGILDFAYIRTIPIVTAAGIEAFLADFAPDVPWLSESPKR